MQRLGYVPGLDGLRALAVTGVVLYHAFGWPRGGWLGVDLFFVLSGFLITTLLLEERREHGRVSLRGFYRRRALRLLPALFVFLGVYALAVLLFADNYAPHALGIVVGVAYFSNFASTVGLDVPYSLGHLWSLSAEEQFYLVWPVLLIFVLGARRRLAGVVLLVALTTVAAVQVYLLASDAHRLRFLFGPDTRAGAIIVGCLLALVLFGRPAPRIGVVGALPAMLVVGAMLTLRPIDEAFGGPLLLFAFACALLICAVLADGQIVSRFLALPPLVGLGRVSYALYLWHLPIVVLFLDWSQAAWSRSLAVACSIGAAVLSYYLVERPFLRRKRHPEVPPSSTRPPRTGRELVPTGVASQAY